MNKNKHILLFQRIIPSYRVGVFRALQRELGIIPCYSKEKRNHSLKSVQEFNDLKTELLQSLYFGKSVTFMLQNVFAVLRKYKPDIVICEGSPSYITLWLLFFLKPFFRYKIVTWSHGIKNKELSNPFSSLSSRLSLMLMNIADAVIIYSNRRKDILKNYISNSKKLFVASNTLDLSIHQVNLKKYKLKGKLEIKNDLKWKSEFNLIYIGRLVKAKKVDLLNEILELIPETIDVSLHLIGDGPELNMLKQKSRSNKRIHFYGSMSDEDIIGKMLFASDFMIMPGYVGLAVVHSFAYGCPVITSESHSLTGPFHSPEFEYIVNGKNGIILKSDANEFAHNILEALHNKSFLNRMSEAAEFTAYNDANIDKFVSGFRNALDYTKKK